MILKACGYGVGGWTNVASTTLHYVVYNFDEALTVQSSVVDAKQR